MSDKKFKEILEKENELIKKLEEVKYERKRLRILNEFKTKDLKYKECFESLVRDMKILEYKNDNVDCDVYMTASDDVIVLEMNGVIIKYMDKQCVTGKHYDVRIEKIEIDDRVFYCEDTYNVGVNGFSEDVDIDMMVIEYLREKWGVEVDLYDVLDFLSIFMNSPAIGEYLYREKNKK